MNLAYLPWVIFWLCCIQPMKMVIEGKSSSSPVAHHKPFIVVWNFPTFRCEKQYGIDLPLGVFDIVENRHHRFQGQNMTIFYKNKLGLYPYIAPNGQWINGGLPQNTNLKRHLAQISRDTRHFLEVDFKGLAVVDWEEWRPLWNQNWGSKKIYQRASKEWVLRKFPELPREKARYFAKLEFEKAAHRLILKTLRAVESLRPMGMWGFYGFPECFNYGYKKKGIQYDGHCQPETIHKNDQLKWLWEVSKAIYPSIYLPEKLMESEQGLLYVHYRIKEALRVAEFSLNISSPPVLPYSRVSYKHSLRFLTEVDLVHTIGESAAMGAAGVVLWGEDSFANSDRRCKNLRKNLISSLGPYVLNVTKAADACSKQLCGHNGRCIRRDPDALNTFLHLNPQSVHITHGDLNKGGEPVVEGQLSADDLDRMWESFQCSCYTGWVGIHCKKRQGS